MLRDAGLHFNQPLTRPCILGKSSLKFFFYFRLLPVQRISLFLSCLNLHADRICSVIIVLVVHPGRIDLLFQYVDLSLKLLPEKICLIQLILRSFNSQIDLLNFLFDGLILRFHLVVAFV